VPKGGGIYKVGTPYKVAGRWYVPREVSRYESAGIGSWYGAAFHGRRTANGEIYDMHALTAGHPTLPLPSYAYVTNLDNGRTILVRVNDRGPYVNDRLIDLSLRSASELGFTRHGLARVRVRYAGRAPLDGSDLAERRHLAAQSWHRGGVEVAQAGSPISTGSIEGAGPALPWSVMTYRRQPEASRGVSGSRRATLGGPRDPRIEAGPFATRAEAERMRHELEHLGPVAVVPEGNEPVFLVRVGPFSTMAAKEAASELAGIGDASIAIAPE
jgi:rare lipoprotein A